VSHDEEIFERGVFGEAAHPLETDPGLVAAGGADRDHRPWDRAELMNADLRRGAVFAFPRGRIAVISRAEPKYARAIRFLWGCSGSPIRSQNSTRPAKPGRTVTASAYS
jgi:hypothetical protein